MLRSVVGYLPKMGAITENVIAFIGPDGTGKSTLSETIAPRVQGIHMPAQRGQYTWTEINAPLMELTLKLRRKIPTLPLGTRRRMVAVTTYSLLYFEQHLRLARMMRRARGRLLFTDSYCWGTVVRWTPESSPVPFWWTAACSAAFPIPRLTFLCGGDPQAIWDRKPDMEPPEIERTIRVYRAYLKARGIPFVELNTTKESFEESVDRVLFEIGRLGLLNSSASGQHSAVGSGRARH